MTKKTMTCPVCKSVAAGDKSYCSVCGWSFPEDCTEKGTLFTGKQLEEYEARLQIMRKLLSEGGEQAKARIQELELSIRQMRGDEEELRQRNRNLEQSVSRLQETERELKQKNSSLEQNISRLRETESELRQKNARLDATVGSSQDQLRELRLRNSSMEQELQRMRREETRDTAASRELKASNERLEKANRELRADVERMDRTSRIARVETERFEKANRDLRATVDRLERSNRELRADNARLEEANRDLRAKAGAASAPKQSTNPTPQPVKTPEPTMAAKEDYNTRIGINSKLSTYSIDEICRRIASGTFEGLYVGDRFRAGTRDYIFAGFDCLPGGYKGVDGKYRDHYAVVIPANCLKEAYMYGSHNENKHRNFPSEQGYKESNIYRRVLPELGSSLQRDFNNHILHKDGQNELDLMSASMLDGTGNASAQLPVFKTWVHTRKTENSLFTGHSPWYWLKDQLPDGRFAACGPDGKVSDLDETANGVWVRPYFCIG